MNNILFVTFIIDRFLSRTSMAAAATLNDAARNVELTELGKHNGPVVTHDAPLLIELFRARNIALPHTLVDIEEALRFRSQISKDQGGQKQWNLWRMGAKFLDASVDAKTVERLLNASSIPPDSEEQRRLTRVSAGMLRQLWVETEEELTRLGEWARFIEKEVPVQQIFHSRQLSGLKVDDSSISDFIKVSENEKFTHFRRLSTLLGSSPMGLTAQKLVEKLSAVGADLPVERVRTEVLEDWLELAGSSSNSAAEVLAYLAAAKDVSVLRRLNPVYGRVYPLFRVHGTVTSRVLVADPGLQQIRKRFRAVIQPDDGLELAYLDYAQFEPGIIAFLAADEVLKAAYESSDLYLALAARIGGSETSRDMAKKIFLSYCYGMTKPRIAALLAGVSASKSDLERFESSVSSFFERFPKVETFREESQVKLRENGVIGTIFGNFRRRTSEGELTYKEQRWAMNHIVQGSASIIFKDALIRLAGRFGVNSILLPMHDAVLLQFSPQEITRVEFEKEAAAMMINAFQYYCPNAKPKVIATHFGS